MHVCLVSLRKGIVWLAILSICMPAFAQQGFMKDRCAPDYVLIKFRPERCQEALKLPIADGLNWLLSQLSLPSGTRLREPEISSWMRDHLRMPNSAAESGGLMLDRFLYLDLPCGLTVAETIEKVRGHPLIDYVEPDGIGVLCLIPNDQWFTNQYQHYIPASDSQPAHYGLLDTPEAWDITTGSSNVTVAIIDSGIAETWELNGRLVPGYNVISNNDEAGFGLNHGTLVATILGANADNPLPGSTNKQGFGIAGVDWQCRLMPIKVADENGQTRASWGAQGIDLAVSNGCQVILFSASVSMPTAEESMTLGRSVSNAVAQGAIFVCPAGNSNTQISEYPALFGIPIVVGTAIYPPSDYSGYRYEYGSWGPELTVIAPGARVYVWTGSNLVSGTSFSAALVAGICSLMVSVHPGLTHEQARTLLELGAWDLGTPGFDNLFGWGMANAYNSVLLAATRITQAEPLGSNRWELFWASPTNDYIKKPYVVQFTPSLSQPWQELTNGDFRYERTVIYTNGVFSHETNRTYWRGPVPTTPGAGKDAYFRVGIRLKE